MNAILEVERYPAPVAFSSGSICLTDIQLMVMALYLEVTGHRSMGNRKGWEVRMQIRHTVSPRSGTGLSWLLDMRTSCKSDRRVESPLQIDRPRPGAE